MRIGNLKKGALIGFVCMMCCFSGSAQEAIESPEVSPYKNTIRWNLTPMAVVGPKSLVFGYERLINDRSSISINLGYLEPSGLTDKEGVPIEVVRKDSKFGLDVTLDYRRYFKNRNKFPAPDGLYWGPYGAYYEWGWKGKLNVENDLGIVENEIELNSKFQMISVGLQMGYQFVIKERLSIDLILMGPSYTSYSLELGAVSTTKLNPDSPFYEDIKELLGDSIPASDIIKEQVDFNEFGKAEFTYAGFRYGLMIGYRFGQK